MVVSFGEIMCRLSTPDYKRFTQTESFDVNYGGAEANVSVSLSNLGVNATHVGVLPDNDLGLAAIKMMRKEGVDVSHLLQREGRMGLYFLETGAMQRAPRIVYDRSDSAFANLNPKDFDWKSILKDAKWFHWTGITPAISQAAADALHDALTVAQELGVKVSGDINYRRNLWQYGKDVLDVMPALIAKTNLVIAGTTDFENCMGIKAETVEEAAKIAQEKNPSIEMVSTSYRNSISASHNRLTAMLWDGETTYTSREYDITHIVDRIGGGDSLMAGLLYGLLHFEDKQTVVEFATAASVLKHSLPGDANLVTVSEVMQLVENKHVGKLLR